MFTTFGMHNKPQPRKCPDCGKRLSNAIYQPFSSRPPIFAYEHFTVVPHIAREHYPNEKIFHIICKCGVILVWSYPNVWKRRHILPLFQLSEKSDIVQVA